MTFFEYIKNEATIEQIAQIFDNLENDNGYYTGANVGALWAMLKEPKTYQKYDSDIPSAYDLAIEVLNEDIKEEKWLQTWKN